MLYVFAGYPKTKLNAGGLRYFLANLNKLDILVEDRSIQYRKEGVFILNGKYEEKLYDTEYHISNTCLHDGITWKWFTENWAFGNGVTVHKTSANYEERVVVHGTEETLNEYLAHAGVVRLSGIELEKKHIWTEGWEQYERRWLPGTCPLESHIVHLTWLVTKERLPLILYKAILQLIEVPGQTIDKILFESKHFSEIRKFNGKPALIKR